MLQLYFILIKYLNFRLPIFKKYISALYYLDGIKLIILIKIVKKKFNFVNLFYLVLR